MSAEALSFIGADRFPVADAQRVAAELDLTEPDPVDLALRTARFLVANDFRPSASTELGVRP
jgi:hypothetical protein